MDKRDKQNKERKKDCNQITIFQAIRMQNFVVISFSKTLWYVKFRNYQTFANTKNKSNKKSGCKLLRLHPLY